MPNTYNPDGLRESKTVNGKRTRFMYDGINVAGELTEDNYNPYGKKESFTINPEGNNTILYQWKAETEKVHNPFGYCGEYVDEEMGLVYLRERMYDSTV